MVKGNYYLTYIG